MIASARPALIAVFLLALGACGEVGEGGGQQGTAHDLTDRAALLTASCSGCHATGGTAIVPLGDLGADSIKESLQNYRSEAEGTTVMHRLARGFSDEDDAIIAARLGADEGS